MKTVVSFFSGAGGMDVGFVKAGFKILWANDHDKFCYQTYSKNIGNHIRYGDISNFFEELSSINTNVDVLIGGPPCQGFSVAGKMDPHDPRSQLVWSFIHGLRLINPRAFIMENVWALGTLEKWEPLRLELLNVMKTLGYSVSYIILNASNFNTPQTRKRIFFIGFKTDEFILPNLEQMIKPYIIKAKTVREVLSFLDRAGTGNNKHKCKSRVVLATKPVLNNSPYVGMLFNGRGRPVRLDGYCSTLSASGGNMIPIIDEEELYNKKPAWVEEYYAGLMKGEPVPQSKEAPPFLRRLTIEEAMAIQTFPQEFIFYGFPSSIYRQIGNAVPCELAYQIARMMSEYLSYDNLEDKLISIKSEKTNKSS